VNKKIASMFLTIGTVLILVGYHFYLVSVSMGPGTILVTPSDTTVWLVIFGLLSAITGAFGFANEEEETI
jgi:hypothetical protein